MKRILPLALCAAALFSLTLSCKKEDAQGGDAVYAIELNKTELQLALDETFALTATVPAPEQSIVTWKSSDPEIVSVDEASGLLTALKDEGEVTITATVSSKRPVQPRATATCTVKVVTNYSLSLDFASLNMAQEATKTLTALPAPESGYGKIEWATTSSSIVQLSKTSGISTVLTAQKSNGTSKVTAKLYSRFDSTTPKATAVCDVEVKSFFVEELGLPSRVDLVMGTPQTLVPSIKPQEVVGTPVTYEVRSGSEYVSVSSAGKLTPLKVSGTTSYAVVRATAQDREKKYQDVKVYVAEKPVYPTGISISGFVSETYVSQTFDPVLTFTPTNTNQKNYTVSSSNKDVATVTKTSAGYHVYAKSSGTTNITVTYNTSETTTKTLTQTLTVFVGPPSIKWTNDQSTELKKGMIVGQTLTVTAKVSNKSNTAVTYTSSNTDVVTVSASGVITAKGRGTAWVTAKSQADPSLTVSTVSFTVYGVPTQIVCTAGEKSSIFLRYGKETSSSTSMTFQIRDSKGYPSRQDLLTVSISSKLNNITKEVTVGSSSTTVKLTNNLTSATSTTKGTLTIGVKDYSSLTRTCDLYEAMYDEYDLKPLDGLVFYDEGYMGVRDGGYRGSGYFDTPADNLSPCSALIFWVGEHPNTNISMRDRLRGEREQSDRPYQHGLAVAHNNIKDASNNELFQWWSVSAAAGDNVKESKNYTDYWVNGYGKNFDFVSPQHNGIYGYEITQGMMYYNQKVKSNSKYTILPVKAIVDYGSNTYPKAVSSYDINTSWYLPTSGEWYMMLHCLGGSLTVSQTLDKINENMKLMSGYKTIGANIQYWSCQEYNKSPDGNAIYMTGTWATERGEFSSIYLSKQSQCKVRPFIAF
ncbi:MAG: Ig-like domain-containing protein [Bacteroidales bacterium]|nr:Ig-like domain-containing protein [Bacteroidales bacterium]